MSVTDDVFAGARLFQAEVSFALLLHFLLQWCAQEAHSPGEASSTSPQLRGTAAGPPPTAQRVSLQEQGSAKPWLGGRYGCPGRTVCMGRHLQAALLSILKTQREAGSCQHQDGQQSHKHRIFCEASPEQVSPRTQDASLWKRRKREARDGMEFHSSGATHLPQGCQGSVFLPFQRQVNFLPGELVHGVL